MELIRGLHNLRDRHRGCVLSIGNFDGFHRGHQALVARLLEWRQRTGVPATVQVFEPTPREFFAPAAAPGRIATFRDKCNALAGAGVDRLLVTRFDHRLAATPAERFVKEILAQRLGVRAVLIGDDFRFGAGRGGDLALLQRLGHSHGFAAEALGPVTAGAVRVSSTAVRDALARPDLAEAAGLLGRPYAIRGRVRPGLKLGRKLGMPTANFSFRRRPALALGIYAVRARVEGGPQQPGVASLGVRPTLGLDRCLLETHLLTEPGDLYGREMEVEFVSYLRPERRFDSLDSLADQMRRDRNQAEAVLAAQQQ